MLCVDMTKCAHFLIRKGFCDWKHALERLSSHEQSVEHIDATQWRICGRHLDGERKNCLAKIKIFI